MELAVLDSTFHRKTIIEDFSSLVWTERFSANGDFELRSPNIAQCLELLPIGGPFDPPTVVGLRDSPVPMIVETHKIENPRRGVPEIITTGRSFETVLDRRVTLRLITSAVARTPWVVEALSPSDAAKYVMDQIVTDHVASPLDAIPEIVIQDMALSTWPAGTAKYPVEPKELYAWVIETLKLADNGLKATLPNASGNQIFITIYEGTDRRQTVVFQASLEEFDSTSHLLSTLGSKNIMVTETKNGLEYSDTGVTPSGLARRVSYQDLSSDITLPAGTDLTNLTKNSGKVALADLTQVVLFSGEIAAQQGFRYGSDYFLGDKVKLSGEYGLGQDVRIAEFIRTQDNTGERSYPTFEAL